jgi:hypothetical protein
MCGLCGLLGGAHWTDEAVDAALPTRQAKLRRAQLLNRVLRLYRLRVDDWQGTALAVHGPTGRTELAASLAELWPKAEAIAGRPLDPLDPALLDHLERADDP